MRFLKELGTSPGFPAPRSDHTWKPLRYLNFYRIALAGLFLGLFVTGVGPSILGRHQPELFQWTAAIYLLCALISAYTIRRRHPAFHIQTNGQILVDIVALTLLMHASGGLTSGIGILLVVAIAGGSIIMAGRLAMLYAAMATLAILGEQVYAHMRNSFSTTAYTHAGLLGVTFFATALLAYVLANRIRESEALASQRSVDLANMEQLNDYIIRNMSSGIVVVDSDERVRMLNAAAWRLLGSPPLKDNQPLENVSAPLSSSLRQWRRDQENRAESFQPDSEAADIIPRFAQLGTGSDAGTLIFLEDSTEVAEELQQMKLASLGKLTASIAHEIRNPLGAISHASQLLQEAPHLTANDQRMTEIIRTHSERMNTIIENVLQLSRREQSHPESLRLKPWLERFASELTSGGQTSPVHISVEADPESIQVYFDPSHLQQVLWNLCQNAAEHASTGDSAPVVTLRGSIGEKSQAPHLDVIDNGPGIDADAAQQIFDPFFTTASKGTGLGLYIARELCECNRARLSYHPAPTGGSCFRISFFDPERLKI